MSRLQPYSSKNVQVTWGGHTFQGLADEGFSIDPNDDVTKNEVGMGGDVSTSLLPDQSGTAAIRLFINSPTNHFLSEAIALQRTTGDLIVSDMSIVDPSGSLPVALKDAHISAKPSIVRGKSSEGQVMEWKFFVVDMLMQPVKVDNTSAQVIIEDVLSGSGILQDLLLR